MNPLMADRVPFTKNDYPVFYSATKTPMSSAWAFQLTRRWETPQEDAAKSGVSTRGEVSYPAMIFFGALTFLLGFLMAGVMGLFV
ncbi:MAG: hypothetical protein ACOYM3_22240 [Terrimicrobiaceae bacterium]